MPDLFPGYDVLRKRDGLSWNDKTRAVVDERLATTETPRFFTAGEFATVAALAAQIVPQITGRPPIPVAALVDRKLASGTEDGYRAPEMPRDGEAWRRGLRALDAEAQDAHGASFAALPAEQRDALIARMQEGTLRSPEWGDVSCKTYFTHRMARDLVFAYYAHPSAWSEIGWGGPASPRGYVRMGFNDRDPWEAAEADGFDASEARRTNLRVG